MDWQRDLPSWPLRHWSRQVSCAPHRWHVQSQGQGPTVLFLHGAGATTHSWAPVMEPLAASCRVVALDLPGHGFTPLGQARRSGLDAMTQDIAALCKQEAWQPDLIVAHSAGAAIALQLAADWFTPQPRIIAVNPALEDFEGIAGMVFPVVAKTLALNPLVPWLFTLGPDPLGRARRLIRSTGSDIPEPQLDLYARLFRDRSHVSGALAMMAQWSFAGLQARLPAMTVGCTLVLGEKDQAVPPARGRASQAKLKGARLIAMEDLGHLAHEEAPDRFVALIKDSLLP